MIVPQFPYTGSQAIVSSDRVTLYSKKDGVFLFGKTTIGLSSPNTINIDSREKVLVFSPKIELGSQANQQVILGNRMVNDLTEVFIDLKFLCDALSRLNETNFSATVPFIRSSAEKLSKRLNDKLINLPNNLSNVTYTE